jgi:hypothetical protein
MDGPEKCISTVLMQNVKEGPAGMTRHARKNGISRCHTEKEECGGRGEWTAVAQHWGQWTDGFCEGGNQSSGSIKLGIS